MPHAVGQVENIRVETINAMGALQRILSSFRDARAPRLQARRTDHRPMKATPDPAPLRSKRQVGAWSRKTMVESTKGRVLVAVGDAQLRDEVLVPGLEAFGFDVTGVGSKAALYHSILTEHFRLIVLDVASSDADGFKFLSHLRAMSDVGIVVLSDSDSIIDRVRVLNEGGDAYLTKPIDVPLLAAVLQSLKRRVSDASVPRSMASGWRFEASGWRLISPDGAAIALSLPERLLLNQLAASAPDPVARNVLIGDISGFIPGFDSARLEMLIHRLRQKVTKKTSEELPLIAVRGIGYILAVK
jgi:DNA-binding response OmpR family regulator